MNNRIAVISAMAGLGLAALLCQGAVAADHEKNPPLSPQSSPDNEPTPTPRAPNVLLSDDFTDDQWGTASNENQTIKYDDDALNMVVVKTNYFVWSTPNQRTYEDIHMEVTVTNHDTDSTTAFGFMCDQDSGTTGNFYYLAMTPAGEYAIAKAVDGENDLFLTNNDRWGTSDLIDKNADSYRIGADCGNGQLALYVDGEEIASVSDDTYTSGGVGLFTWSGEKAKRTNVSFDDFQMTELR